MGKIYNKSKLNNVVNLLASVFMSFYIFFPFIAYRPLFAVCAVISWGLLSVKNYKTFFIISRHECLYVVIILYSFFVTTLNNVNTIWLDSSKSTLIWFNLAFVVYMLLSRANIDDRCLVNVMFLFALAFMVATYLQFLGGTLISNFIDSYLKNNIEIFNNYYAAQSWGAYWGLATSNFENSFFISIGCGFLWAKSYIRKNNLLIGIMYIVCVGAMMLSGKRSILLANIIIVMLLCFMPVRKIYMTVNSALKKIIAFAIIICFFCYIDYQTNAIDLLIGKAKLSSSLLSGREEIYGRLLMDSINDGVLKLLFGHGLGSTYALFSQGAHNIYIQILYELGIIGLVMFFIFFYDNLKYSLQLIIHCHKLNLKVLIVFCLYMQFVFLIYGTMGNPLFYNSSLLIYFIFIAINKKVYNNILRYGDCDK